VTIELSETIVLPIDADTIIDGEGLVTLDGGGAIRHFLFDHPDWMNNPNKFVLQRITLINGLAPAGEYFEQDPQNPECAYGYKEGSGGAGYMRHGVLHVIGSHFEGNSAALIGPDVGGGGICVVGVPEVIISGSSFGGNRGANGGAIGMLFAGSPQIYNSLFEDNTAEGIGRITSSPAAPISTTTSKAAPGATAGRCTSTASTTRVWSTRSAARCSATTAPTSWPGRCFARPMSGSARCCSIAACSTATPPGSAACRSSRTTS